MLYGSMDIQNDVIREVKEYCAVNGFKPIFGSMVGSISHGVNYINSDYDTRFLYLRSDFPDNICLPDKMCEKDLIKRIWPKENKVWEWIPLWEFSSFLQFLTIPSFKNDFSVGLYNVVGWTFQSPYQWDPYGIRNKIMPLINDIFIKEYEIEYHLKLIEGEYEFNSREPLPAKTYLSIFHSAMTIDWSLKRNSQPPVYYDTLQKCCCNDDLRNTVKKIIIKAKQEAAERAQFTIDGAVVTGELSDLHYKILTERNPIIDEFINQKYNEGKEAVKNFEISDQTLKRCQEQIKYMYEVVWESVNEI